MVKSHIYIFLPGSPGPWDCPNRAPNWPNQALPKRPIIPTQTTTRQTSKFTKLKYFVTLTCSHGGVKVKMLHFYIVPSVEWYGRTDRHADHYMAALRGAIIINI